MYHSLWCHLSSLPYQFLIFEDMGDWQPSPGVGNLPTLGPRTPRLFTGTWFLTWTTKDKQLGFLQRTNYYFLIVRSRVGNVSQARIFWLLHIRNAVSNPNPLCNGWELLQYTVLIGGDTWGWSIHPPLFVITAGYIVHLFDCLSVPSPGISHPRRTKQYLGVSLGGGAWVQLNLTDT